MVEKKQKFILGPIRIFMNVFGLEFGTNQKNHFCINRIKIFWTLMWLVISFQYALYTLTQLAFPNLINSFLNSVKGVRSQINSVAIFLGHVNGVSTVIICHWILLFNLQKVTKIVITVGTFVHDHTNWRRFSILGIIGISLSVHKNTVQDNKVQEIAITLFLKRADWRKLWIVQQ